MKTGRCFLTIMLMAAVSLISVHAALAETVTVNNAQALAQAVSRANQGGPKTILLRDGRYTLDQSLWIEVSGITIRSASGNRKAVVIEGRGMKGSVSHCLQLAGSNITVRDVTLRKVKNHAIQIHGELNADSAKIINVHILDTGEQMVKVSFDSNKRSYGADNGILEKCLLEYSAGRGPQYYIGGIDAHNAKNWKVRNNIFKNIRSPRGETAEHAVHFWSNSQGTLVEGNKIINCDRGIGFGLGDRGHRGGIIRNNMIYHDAKRGYGDVGIGLESASNALVKSNAVFQEHDYPNAIAYRYRSTTGVRIIGNVTNRAIAKRDGASARLTDNYTNARSNWFVNPRSGDLRLTKSAPSVSGMKRQ